jgi:hypothetical protein
MADDSYKIQEALAIHPNDPFWVFYTDSVKQSS